MVVRLNVADLVTHVEVDADDGGDVQQKTHRAPEKTPLGATNRW